MLLYIGPKVACWGFYSLSQLWGECKQRWNLPFKCSAFNWNVKGGCVCVGGALLGRGIQGVTGRSYLIWMRKTRGGGINERGSSSVRKLEKVSLSSPQTTRCSTMASGEEAPVCSTINEMETLLMQECLCWLATIRLRPARGRTLELLHRHGSSGGVMATNPAPHRGNERCW